MTNGFSFLGSSFGYSPAITSFPTYPDPAPAVALFWTPDESIYLSGGLFDANRSDRAGIFAGHPYAVDATNGGIFLVEETGFKWKLGAGGPPGRLAGGLYKHTGTFKQFDGNNQRGTSGVYAVFDQTVLPAAGVSVLCRSGLANADISLIDQHIGTGMQWMGPIPTARANDIAGLGSSLVHFSHDSGVARDFELAIEGFYKVQVTPWFNVQPDVQYIINPDGRPGRNALVATVRVELDF